MLLHCQFVSILEFQSNKNRAGIAYRFLRFFICHFITPELKVVIGILLYDMAMQNKISFPRPYQIDIRDYKELFPKPNFYNDFLNYLRCQRAIVTRLIQKKNCFTKNIYDLLYNTYWLVCHLIKDTYVIWKKAYIPEDISFDNNKEEYAFRVMNIYNVFRSGDMHKTFLSRINCLTLKDIFIVPMNGGNLNEKF